jgi:hypothetical protein
MLSHSRRCSYTSALLPLQSSAFEAELWSYLEALKLRPSDALYCLDLLARHDFSAARAHIIASGGWSRAGLC